MKKLKRRVSNSPAITASKGWNQIRAQSFLLHFHVFNSYYVYRHVKLFSFSKCEQVSFLKTKMKLFSPTGIVLSVEIVSLGESRLFMGWDLGARRKKGPSAWSSVSLSEQMVWDGTCCRHSWDDSTQSGLSFWVLLQQELCKTRGGGPALCKSNRKSHS